MENPGGFTKAPKAVVCYVCGRQYGTHSFDIHLKQCKELFLTREMQKDPRDRKPLPRDPLEIAGDDSLGVNKKKVSEMSAADLEKRNELAGQMYNDNVMVRCANCGRTFALPEKLATHNKSCTPSNPAKRVGGGEQQTQPPQDVRNSTTPHKMTDARSPPSDASSRPRTSAGSTAETTPPPRSSSGSRAMTKLSAARELRNGAAALNESVDFGGSPSSKSDSMEVLTARVDALEVANAAMLKTIAELREEMSKLKASR